MTKTAITNLSEKTIKELNNQLDELKKELLTAKLQLKVSKLANTRKPGRLRDDIARIKTILTVKVSQKL